MQTLIPLNFLHSTFTCFATHNSMFSKTSKLVKKSDTQPKQGGKEMVAPFPSKTPLEQ